MPGSHRSHIMSVVILCSQKEQVDGLNSYSKLVAELGFELGSPPFNSHTPDCDQLKQFPGNLVSAVNKMKH